MYVLLLLLQIFHVLFLLLHDWVPLGRLNDVRAVRAAEPASKLLVTTLLSTVPFLVCLAGSLNHLGQVYPGWLWVWLWISYGLLFAGELRAWWIPYFFGTSSERTARYATMFGNTITFLPAHHDIRINTLHFVLHALTLATLLTLAAIRF